MNIVQWLLAGDISIQYGVYKYLFPQDSTILAQYQERISQEGYGARFLACQNKIGHWGLYYYQPKWTCTHYTLLDLKNLEISRNETACCKMVKQMFQDCQKEEGSLNLSKYDHPSDLAIDGMALNYSAYFDGCEENIHRLIDSILARQEPTGQFDLAGSRGVYTPMVTICVLEGIGECLLRRPSYRTEDLLNAEEKAINYLIEQRFFMNSTDKKITQLTYPSRYRYDLLRMASYLARRDIPYQPAFQPLFDWILSKQKFEGWWYLENILPGNIHFEMESKNQPSRLITLKALHVLHHYKVLTL